MIEDVRMGHPSWHILEVVGRRLGNGDGAYATEGEVKWKLLPKQSERTIDLGLKVEIVMPELVEFVVHIVGRWDKPEQRELEDEEFQVYCLGYRLDELVAAVNYELVHLASRIRTTAPYIPQEQLEQLRATAFHS